MNLTVTNLTKAELSCRVIRSLIFYLKDRYDQKTLEKFIGDTGLSLEYLEDENNWISFEYNNMLLEKVVEFTKNPDAPFEAGSYVISKESYGFFYSILSVLKVFGSPKMAYQQIAKMGATFNNVCKIEVLETGLNHMVMSWDYYPEFHQTHINCMHIRGQLAYVPGFWGLPNAEVESLKCEADGDEACVFRVKWKPIPRTEWVLTVILAALVGLNTLLFFLLPGRWMGPKDLIIAVLAALFIIAVLWLSKYGRMIEENKKINVQRSQALEDSLESLQREYRNLEWANQQVLEEAEKLSILKDFAEIINKYESESDTINNVIRLLVGRLGFDYGYCLVFNENYEIQMEPEVVRLDTRPFPPMHLEKSPEAWEETFRVIHQENKPANRGFYMLPLKEGGLLSMVMPVRPSPGKKYYFVFDSLSEQRNLEDSYHFFFITVSNQIQLALKRIFAHDATKSIVANIPSSIAIFDLESLSLQFCNQSFLDDIGQKSDSIIGQDIMDVIGFDQTEIRDKFRQQVRELPRHKLVDFQEITTRKRTFGYTLFMMPEHAGKKNEAGIIMKNITTQVQMKEQLIRAEKMAALGTLVSGVAHEINNPLYAILGNAEIIRDETDSPDISEYAKSIIDFTMSISDIVKDLSSYSRGLRQEKPGMVELSRIMDEALRIVGYNKSFIDVKVKKKYKKTPPVYALAGELTQIYVNLINNAVDGMKGKGVLTLSSSMDQGYILTSIADTGEGIPEENLSKIFDPFFTTKETGKGTGLGLSIVYRLVTKYDGIISAKNEEGSGAVFEIRFPPGASHA